MARNTGDTNLNDRERRIKAEAEVKAAKAELERAKRLAAEAKLKELRNKQ